MLCSRTPAAYSGRQGKPKCHLHYNSACIDGILGGDTPGHISVNTKYMWFNASTTTSLSSFSDRITMWLSGCFHLIQSCPFVFGSPETHGNASRKQHNCVINKLENVHQHMIFCLTLTTPKSTFSFNYTATTRVAPSEECAYWILNVSPWLASPVRKVHVTGICVP